MPYFRDYHRTVIGYHGTRRQTALDIIAGRRSFALSRNDDDWLGHGVYFWEYAPKQAWQWAKRRFRGEDVAVVASMIRLGNCLDLLDPDNAAELTACHAELLAEAKATGARIRVNRNARKFLDCQVLEYAYANLEPRVGPIESVRAVYVPTESRARLWRRSWLYHQTHVQLCVRNPECILGTWLVTDR